MKKFLLLLAISLSIAGCTAFRTSDQAATTKKEKAGFSARLAQATEPLRSSWKRVTETKRAPQVRDWNWQSGIAVGAPRAEQVAAIIPHDAVAQLFPGIGTETVQLASTDQSSGSFRITNVAGYRVQNCADLRLAIEKALTDGKHLQVDLSSTSGGADSADIAVPVSPAVLAALPNAVAPEHPVMKAANQGNQSLIIRDGNVSATLMIRVERLSSVLHVILSMSACGNQDTSLPVEVLAKCDGKPLRCLSVAETLARTYQQTPPLAKTGEAETAAFSFATVSERDDYLVPINYNSLYADLDEQRTQHSRPAFANLPGISYPGPAVLGDARALSAFLLQRQQVRAGDPEKTGWVIFAGPELSRGGILEIMLDLGSGLKSYHFDVPTI